MLEPTDLQVLDELLVGEAAETGPPDVEVVDASSPTPAASSLVAQQRETAAGATALAAAPAAVRTRPAPPAPPADPPLTTGQALAVVLVVVLALAALLAVVRLSEGDPPRALSPSAGPEALGPSLSPAPSATPTPAGPAQLGARISAPAAGISVQLPRSWGGGHLEAGAQAAASQIYPSDVAQAAATLPRLQSLPDSAVLFALDLAAAERTDAFVPNLNVLIDASVAADLDLQETAEAEARGLRAAFDVQEQTPLAMGAVPVVRIGYRAPTQGFSGLAYVAKEGGTTYVLTYTFPLDAADVDLADASAATFVVR